MVSIPWNSELGDRIVAIKLKEDDNGLGAKVLLNGIENFIGVRGGIILLQEDYLKIFDKHSVQYEKYFPKTNNIQEIYNYFGVLPIKKELSLAHKIISYLRNII